MVLLFFQGGDRNQEILYLHQLITFLKHLLTANNQHGVHSPFVYNYLTKCLYSKPHFKTPKSENVVLKSIPYFSIKKFKISSANSRIEKRIVAEFGLEVSNEAPFDLLYFDNPTEDMLYMYKDKIHNNSIILIRNIHRTADATFNWESLKQNKMVKVSIDMFHCGALFIREEQVKEHFKIRI